MSTTAVDPRRVAQCLLAARNLFGPTGRWWIKGDLKREDDVKPNMYGYCAAGAIREVEGFSDEERNAAELALAELISKGEDDYYLSDLRKSPDFAEEIIFNNNDDEDTTFADVRGWFTRAAARLKRN